MGVFEVNKHNEELDGILGELGMAEPDEPHWRIANYLTRVIGAKFPYLEAGTEAPTGKNKNYKVVDFAIRKFYKGGKNEILFFIEICHKSNYKQALKRCINCKTNNKSIQEIFIYQYDKKIFEKFYDEKNVLKENYSNFLNLNLWELIKDFVKYIDETS